MSCRDHSLRNVRAFYLLFAVSLSLTPQLLAQSTITTLAGTEYIFTGDGKSALDAPLGLMSKITLDQKGNPVFSDPGNGMVFRLNPDGTVTVLAGNGLQTYSGDGGQAVNAALHTPQGVAYDSAGNLYITDLDNNRVRMVTPSGIISTVAGNGLQKYAGESIPAVQASLSLPLCVAVDPSNSIYIADLTQSGGTRIRKVTPDGIIVTIAGTGQPPASNALPEGVAAKNAAIGDVENMVFDAKGNLYFAEFTASKIRKIDTNGILTTVAGDGQDRFAGDGGQAVKASLDQPGGVALDSAGNIYISDTNNNVIRKVNPQGIISTIAGTAGVSGFFGDGRSALSARLNGAFGLAVDPGGNIFIADTNNFRVREVKSSGTITTVAGNGTFRYFPDGTGAVNAPLFEPHGIAVDSSGNFYISDTSNSSIRKIDPRTGQISTIAGNGSREYGGDGGPAVNAQVDDPTNVAFDSAGNMYIADTDNEVIRKVAKDGTISTVAGLPDPTGNYLYNGDGISATKAFLDTPIDIAVDSAGNLYISDYGHHRIRKVATNGTISTIAGDGTARFAGDGGPASKASLRFPRGLAFDQSGNLYVVDYGNSRVRRIAAADGTITTVAGGGTRIVTNVALPATQAQLTAPLGIALDRAGNMYISESTTSRVYEVAASSGNISILAGNGNYGFSGDGGPAPLSSFTTPYGLAFDSAGDLLIADIENNRIRVILAAVPSLTSSPSTLSFTAKSAGAVTDTQNISLGTSVAGLVYTLTTPTTTGGNWLSANVTTGTIPATVQIKADPTGLDPGTYQGSVVVATPNSRPSSTTVGVTFTVQPPDVPHLGVGSTFLMFSLLQGGQPSTQSLSVLNQGGGSLTFAASVQTDVPGTWLSVNPGTGTATPTAPGALTVQADPTGLNPGTYTGSIIIMAGSETKTVPVTLAVAGITKTILVSQPGLQYNAVFQGGAPLPQTFAVINTGQGDLDRK